MKLTPKMSYNPEPLEPRIPPSPEIQIVEDYIISDSTIWKCIGNQVVKYREIEKRQLIIGEDKKVAWLEDGIRNSWSRIDKWGEHIRSPPKVLNPNGDLFIEGELRASGVAHIYKNIVKWKKMGETGEEGAIYDGEYYLKKKGDRIILYDLDDNGISSFPKDFEYQFNGNWLIVKNRAYFKGKYQGMLLESPSLLTSHYMVSKGITYNWNLKTILDFPVIAISDKYYIEMDGKVVRANWNKEYDKKKWEE